MWDLVALFLQGNGELEVFSHAIFIVLNEQQVL